MPPISTQTHDLPVALAEIPASERPTPKAFLGFRADFKTGELFVRVCARCPDKHEAEAEAHRLKCRCTHTLCDTHFALEMAKLTGDHP